MSMNDRIRLLEGADVGWRALSRDRETRAFASLDWVERRDADASVAFRGYASVFDTPYDVAGLFAESVNRAAFNATLRTERKIHLLANHDGVPLASTQGGTLRLRADEHGLAVLAELDLRSPWAQTVASAIERNDMDEMSFGFQALADEWNDDYTERQLLEVKLFEVSVVPRGANPATEASVEIAEAPASEPQRSAGKAKYLAVLAAAERLKRPA
jgi:HK97 family phage prohead protease